MLSCGQLERCPSQNGNSLIAFSAMFRKAPNIVDSTALQECNAVLPLSTKQNFYKEKEYSHILWIELLSL